MRYSLTLDITPEQAEALRTVLNGAPNVDDPSGLYRITLANMPETQRLTVLKWLMATGNEQVDWTSKESIAMIKSLVAAVIDSTTSSGGHRCRHHTWLDDIFGRHCG